MALGTDTSGGMAVATGRGAVGTARARPTTVGSRGRRGAEKVRPVAGPAPVPGSVGNRPPDVPPGPTGPPGTGTGPAPVPTTGGPQSGPGTPADILNFYQAPLPPIVTAYMQNLQKGGFSDLPSFNDLYGTYRATAEKETARRAAALKETYGSSGARYGSDLLGAESRLQENLGVDLAQQASQFLLGLRQEQFGEVSGMANLQYGASEAAMARMWEDFLRRTSPPPGLSQLYGQADTYGLPATVLGG